MLEMFRKRDRTYAAAKVTLGTLLLLGCSAHAQQPVTSRGAKAAFTLDTPVEVIAADPRGKAILVQDLPGLMSNPHYLLFSDMSLSQIAPMSGGRLSKVRLAKVQVDLDQLAAEEAAGR